MMQIVDPGKPTGNIMQRVFDVLAHHGPCTIDELERILDFPAVSIRRAVARLCDRVERVRIGKRFRYALKDGAARPTDLRGAHTVSAHRMRKDRAA